MLSGVVILVTDRPSRSAFIAETLRGVGSCEVVGPNVDWTTISSVCAVIADLDYAQSTALQCLLRLQTQSWAATRPLLCLLHRLSDKSLAQAQRLGAKACLPFYTDAHVVVTALLNLLNPAEGDLNASVRRCAERAGAALADLFRSAARSGYVSLAGIDQSVDPILAAIREGGLARWLNTIRAHDDGTYQHSLVVAGLAAQFASHVGFPQAQRQRLVRAALVHDVGKARIPRVLLLKRGPLDPDETAIMRTHTVLGYEILIAGGNVDPAMSDAVRHHHELLDGSGYPDGLSGDAISDIVRFLSICDVYSALTERRSYREAMSPEEAIKVLYGMAAKVEPRFVEAFDRAVAQGLRRPPAIAESLAARSG